MEKQGRISIAPLLDVLQRRPPLELAQALSSRTENIIRAWEVEVRKVVHSSTGLSVEAFRNHLPEVLSQVVAVMSVATAADAEALLHRTKPEHGVTRLLQHYDIDEIIAEFLLMRRVIIEQAEAKLQRRLTTPEDIALHLAIDVVTKEGIVGFVNRLKEDLQTAAAAQSKYLTYMSHDVRNELNAVYLTLEVLRVRLAAQDGFAEEANDLEIAQHAIMQTVQGTQRMLEAELLKRKAGHIKLAKVDLPSLISDITRQYASQSKRKGVPIVAHVNSCEPIHSDPQWMQSILQNLVGNALKYSEKGTVKINCDRRDGDYVVRVSDEGPGISAEHVQRIFNAFERAETFGESGVGLGLAIASQAAKLLGGAITVESTPGVGSTFSLILPLGSALTET